MSGLDALFADLWSGLASPEPTNFQAFPGAKKHDLERQVSDKSDVSSVSRISSPKNRECLISSSETPQARAGVRAGAGARDYPATSPEILETLEKPIPAEGCLSSYLSRNLEKKGRTGNPPTLRVLLTLASDPDRQLAFDERAAYLEFECGMGHAEAEAEAAKDVLPALADVPLPPTAGSRLAGWFAGMARLSRTEAPCPDYRGADWSRVYANALAFLDTFGAQAEALGWQTHELFGVHPECGTIRPDHCGALVLTGGPVRAITADTIAFERTTYRRTSGSHQGVPLWEFGR